MTLNYILTETDYMAFQTYYSESHPWVRKIYLYFLPIALIIVSLVLPAIFNKEIKYIMIITCTLLAIIWVVFFKKLYPKLLVLVRPLRIKIIKIILQKKQNTNINSSTQLTLTDNEIICATNKGEVKLFWSSIANYSETSEYYFVFFTSKNNVAFVIPKRCFTNEEEVFKQILNERINN